MRSPSFSVLALAGLIATSTAKIPFVATSDVIPLDSSSSSSASTSSSAVANAATAVSAGVAAIPITPKRSPRVSMASRRQANGGGLCTVIGSTALPAEVETVAESLANSITCSSATTIANVPDATSGSTSFSDVDFSTDAQKRSPLQFALDEFATDAGSLADTDLQDFQDKLNVYLATEAGIRSVGGSLAIKVPKFFLQMQVSRIQTAQGNPPEAAGQQVDHLRDKVLKNAAGESKALLDQVTKLATQVS